MSKHPIVSPTYRKRTDHGDHGRRNRAAAGPITCPDCGAFYFRRRWIRSEDPLAIAQIGLPTGIKRCPACEAERQARPSGVLTVAGRFFEQHTADIEALLRRGRPGG